MHDERLTWGAGGVLLIVTAMHAAGIGKLLLTPLNPAREKMPEVFQVSLERLPPPRLPQEIEKQPPVPNRAPRDEQRQKVKITRPVPILVDTPTTNPVPPDTQVKQYEIGDELRPGEPGPPMPEGAETSDENAGSVAQTPVVRKMKPVDVRPPVYPPRCLRLGIEGIVRVRVLVGEDGRPQEVTVGKTSGDASLDEAAVDAVRQWRFEAAKRDGVPVRAWALVPIEFKLID